MRRARWLAVALLVAMVGVAGCIGLSGDDETNDADIGEAAAQPGEEQPTASDGDGAAADAGTSGAQAPSDVLTYDVEPVDTTIWANDSFTAADSCYASGCPTGSAFHQTEVSEPLAQGAPTTITAELTYEAGPTVFAEPIDLYLYSSEATFYNYELTEEDGREQVTTTVRFEGEPIVAEVFYNWPTGSEPDVNYTLRIDIETELDVIPSGVPVAVQAEPGQTFEAERAGDGEDPVGLLAFGPDDALQADVDSESNSLEASIPEDAAAGEHVLVVPDDSGPVRLSSNASSQMRALGFSYTTGEYRQVQGQAVEWSFETSERPLAVGLVHRMEPPVAATAANGQATLEGPTGTLFEDAFGCNGCLYFFGAGFGWLTPLGDDRLAAGSYDASYEPTGEAQTSVSHLVVDYER